MCKKTLHFAKFINYNLVQRVDSIMKKRIISYLILFLLFILIIIRLFTPDSQYKWISIINCIGLLSAYIMLGIKLLNKIHNVDNKRFILGVFVLILSFLLLLLGLVLTDVLLLSTKANDVMLLITLLLSLPTDVYLSWVKG